MTVPFWFFTLLIALLDSIVVAKVLESNIFFHYDGRYYIRLQLLNISIWLSLWIATNLAMLL